MPDLCNGPMAEREVRDPRSPGTREEEKENENMNLLAMPRLCLKCGRTTEPENELCPHCGVRLVNAVVKLLTVNDEPVPDEKLLPGAKEISWPLSSIRIRIERKLSEGTGRTECHCGQALKGENLRMYPHEAGTLVEGYGRQWLYIHCPKCQYDWSLWKLGIHFENERPTPAPPKPFSNPMTIPSG